MFYHEMADGVVEASDGLGQRLSCLAVCETERVLTLCQSTFRKVRRGTFLLSMIESVRMEIFCRGQVGQVQQ